MQAQCECGKFGAELTGFPKNTPGRLMCYCDDCQTYLHFLGRTDLLDSAGGTEIIPVYPAEYKITKGHDSLSCLRLSPNGLFRWYTSCCNTPIGNIQPKFPWIGNLSRIYTVKDPNLLEKTLGPIKSRIQGRFAQGTLPKGTADKLGFKDIAAVVPFLLKGLLLGKAKPSPFYQKDQTTPIVSPRILSLEERNEVRKRLGFKAIVRK